MTRRGGFTLVELIVVLGIFAVLSVMAYGGLSSVLSARTRVLQSFERTAALQKGWLRVRNDLQQLRARPVRDGYGQEQPPLVVLADGAVEFTRGGWRNPTSQPRSALERVAYAVNDDKQLVRRSWRVLDRAQDSQPVDVAVFEQVEDAQWRFLDESRQWHNAWPDLSAGTTPQGPAPPPRAVELTLQLTDLGTVHFLFSATNAAAPPPVAPPPATP